MSPDRSAERVYGDIVRLAHSGLDSETLRRRAAARLGKAIGASSYGFVSIDPATLLFTGAVQENIDDATLPRFLHNEYAEADFNKVTELVTRRSRVGVLSAQTGGRLQRSMRFRTILKPEGWGDELRATFISAGRCWGFICIHRDRQSPNFGPGDARLVTRLAPHLGDGLRKSLLIDPTPTTSAGEINPGLIELSDELEVIAMNPAARALLSDLAHDDQPGHARPLPLAVYSVVSQLRAADTCPATAAPPRLRVRGQSGRWLTLHASRLAGADVQPQVAVIIEPATPPEIAPLIVHAYGLTKRESEICRLVLQGLSTAQIAQRLHITTNTVQGHVQAIFEKTDVRSRRELAGRLFSTHYWPLLGEALGTQGRFAAWN